MGSWRIGWCPPQKLFPCNPETPWTRTIQLNLSWLPDPQKPWERTNCYYFKPLIWGWFIMDSQNTHPGPFSTPQLSHSVSPGWYTLFFFPFHYFITRFSHLSWRPRLGYCSSMQTSLNASVLASLPTLLSVALTIPSIHLHLADGWLLKSPSFYVHFPAHLQGPNPFWPSPETNSTWVPLPRAACEWDAPSPHTHSCIRVTVCPQLDWCLKVMEKSEARKILQVTRGDDQQVLQRKRKVMRVTCPRQKDYKIIHTGFS